MKDEGNATSLDMVKKVSSEEKIQSIRSMTSIRSVAKPIQKNAWGQALFNNPVQARRLRSQGG